MGQGKVGVGVGGERGGRYKLKYFTPISYPHIPGKREMLIRKGDKKDDSFTLSTSMKRKREKRRENKTICSFLILLVLFKFGQKE